MTSPYDAITGLEWFFYIAGVSMFVIALVIALGAWVYWSANKMILAYGSFYASLDSGRWESILLPHKDDLADVFMFFVLIAVNLALVSFGVFFLGWVVYVS